MGSSYTNSKRRRGKPTKVQQLSKLAICLGAIVLVSATTYTIIKVIRGSDTTQESSPYPYGTLQELTSLRTFIPAYLSVNCKEPLLVNTQTIRITGTIESGENSDKFELIKMKPDRMLFKLEHDTLQFTYGVSGASVWRRVRIPQQEDKFDLIEGDEAQTWRAQAHFFDRIIDSHLGNGAITAIQPAKRNGNDCLKVRIHDADYKTIETFIDPQTMYPIAESQQLQDGSVQQTEYFDYRNIDGMPIPFQMTTSIDGRITTRIQLEKAALNTGIMSRLFDVPDALL
jgi:hypothetical protein